MSETPKVEMHAIVELMGRAQIAGKVSEQVMFGTALLRCDVPKTSQRDGFTKFYAAGAIYCITPTSEEIAQAAAERFNEAPINPWLLPTSPLLAAKIQTYEATFDEDEVYLDADDFDDDFDGPLVPDVEMPDMPEPEENSDKLEAAKWARVLLKEGFVVLDTETTGLNKGRDDEPVQIAIIDQAGTVMLDTLLKPSFPIPADATRIHGITDEMVKDAPTFADIQERFIEAIRGKRVVIYNASYDQAIIVNATKPADPFWVHASGTTCAMAMYAQFYGEWNDYRGSYKWQSLVNACSQQGIEVGPVPAHSALGDCLRTLALIRKMAEYGV